MNSLRTYACYNKNNELRIRSSSGAVFFFLESCGEADGTGEGGRFFGRIS